MKTSVTRDLEDVPAPRSSATAAGAKSRKPGRRTLCTRCGGEARRPYPFPQDWTVRHAVLCGDCQSHWDALVADLALRWHASFRRCVYCRRPYDATRFHSSSPFGHGCSDCVLRASVVFLGGVEPGSEPPVPPAASPPRTS